MHSSIQLILVILFFFCCSCKNEQQNPHADVTNTTEETVFVRPSDQKLSDRLIQDSVILTSAMEEKLTDVQAVETKNEVSEKNEIKQSRMVFDSTLYDFGEITEGDIVEINFTFTNEGNAPLLIKSAKASCGCTQPSYPFIPIDPGKSGFIGVQYNSLTKSGKQSPKIRILANDAKQKHLLQLNGFVRKNEDSNQ